MSSVLLFVFLCLLTVAVIAVQYNGWLSPSALFCLGFDIALFNGLTQYRAWAFELQWTTVFLIGGSAFVFVAVCQFTHLCVVHITGRRTRKEAIATESQVSTLRAVHIPFWIYLAVLIIQAFTIVAVLCFIAQATDATANHYSLTQMIGRYDYMAKFSNFDKPIRGVLGLFYTGSCASGYVCGFILIKNWLAERRIVWWALINLVLSALMPFLVGGRAGTIQLLLALIVMYFMLLRATPVEEQKRKRRVAVCVSGSFVIIGLLLFKPLLRLLGRSTGQHGLYQYLSIYIGAPIKNLDIYLMQNVGHEQQAQIFGETTFNAIAQSLSRWAGQPVTKNFGVTQPFQTIHDLDLGNVYTSLYSLVWDFGLWGSLIFVALMGLLVQLSYEWLATRSARFYRSPIDISIILYAFLTYGVVFAFLSNRFYSTVVSSVFVRQAMVWITACGIAYLFDRPRISSTYKQDGE